MKNLIKFKTLALMLMCTSFASAQITGLALQENPQQLNWESQAEETPYHPMVAEAIATNASPAEFEGLYNLKTRFRGDGECLEGNEAGSNIHGGNAFMAPCANAKGQTWRIVPAGGGYYHLKNVFRGDGECLEGNEAGSNVMGGSAFMSTCGNIKGQLWKIESVGGGYYTLKNNFRGDGECLEGNEAGSNVQGGNAFMAPCKMAQGQLWKLEKIADDPATASTSQPQPAPTNPTPAPTPAPTTTAPTAPTSPTTATGPSRGNGQTTTPVVTTSTGTGTQTVKITVDAPAGKTVIFEGKVIIQDGDGTVNSTVTNPPVTTTNPTPNPPAPPKPAYVPLPAPTNLSTGKTARQSSSNDHWFGHPSYAVDGNKKANFSTTRGQNSITHTHDEDDPWWEVDLGRVYEISEVNIWNRLDGCCWDRLQNFYVMVSETPISAVSTSADQFGRGPYSFTSQSEATKSIKGKKMGRYVRIFIKGNDKTLSLTEVEVIGK